MSQSLANGLLSSSSDPAMTDPQSEHGTDTAAAASQGSEDDGTGAPTIASDREPESPAPESTPVPDPIADDEQSPDQDEAAASPQGADTAPDAPPDSIPVPSDDDDDDDARPDPDAALSPSEKSGSGQWTPHDVQKGNNLIVNYVPRSFTDQTLYDLFVPFGEIESARAIIDRQTGQCQGYGFVKFTTKEAAAGALAHFQAAAPDTRQLKVHYARPSSTHKQCNIYVTGLPINFTEADTAALFEPYGPVVECKILIGKDGESRGCGFVRLCDVAKTHAAITALNETVPPGGSSRIGVALAAGTRKDTGGQVFPAAGAAAFCAAPYAAPIPPYYAPPAAASAAGYPPHPYYQAALGAYGAVGRGVAQPYAYYGGGAQPYGRYPPGYGPVRHAPGRPDPSSPYGAPGPVITPGPIAPVPPVAPNGGRQLYTGYCLFCFNLPMEYDETALRAIFSQYGNVSSSKIMRDPGTGRSKGYGFVNVDTEQQALAAIQALNGYPLNGKTLKVQFKTHGPVKASPGGPLLGQMPPPTGASALPTAYY